MAERIHIVVDPLDKERFRRHAEQEGKSLSEWLRDVARQRVEQDAPARLATVEELRAFFNRCGQAQAGQGQEPDWEDHLKVIDESIGRGSPGT